MAKKLLGFDIDLDEFMNQLTEKVASKVLLSIQEENKKDLDGKFISRKEACVQFNPKITTRTLFNWEKAGLIKPYNIGNLVYYRHGELMAAVKTRKKYDRLNEPQA
jgi:hypothetical protein